MTEEELTQQDLEVAQSAVAALKVAQDRAVASGQTVVVVIDNKLVQIGADGQQILKVLQPRQRVDNRVKRARS